jgi:hypothetical protein
VRSQHKSSQRQQRPLRRWRGIALALLATASLCAVAVPTTQSFGVTVPLNTNLPLGPGPDEVGACKRWIGSSADVRLVSIACGSKEGVAEMPRFLLNIYHGGARIGMVDGQAEPGMITSWRIVRGSNREYLEMMVGW